MSTSARARRDGWVADVCMHIADRAEAGGWMVAVRHGSDAVTFAALSAAVTDYRRSVGVQEMSLESGLTAALLHTVPGLVDLGAVDRARALDQMIAWLGRDVAPQAPSPLLRTVG